MLDAMVSMTDVVTNLWSLGERPQEGPNGIMNSFRASDGYFAMQVVRERSGPSELFDRADARALSALANHAAMSLENLRLIEQLRDEAHEREQLALHDALTGLGNRRLFHRNLADAMQHCAAAAPGAPPR